MLICGSCGREMLCCKTDKAVYFDDARYAGDEFQCPECNTFVIKCNNNNTFDPDGKPKNRPCVRGRESLDKGWTLEERLRTAKDRYEVV